MLLRWKFIRLARGMPFVIFAAQWPFFLASVISTPLKLSGFRQMLFFEPSNQLSGEG
jgi:hypothetical protein